MPMHTHTPSRQASCWLFPLVVYSFRPSCTNEKRAQVVYEPAAQARGSAGLNYTSPQREQGAPCLRCGLGLIISTDHPPESSQGNSEKMIGFLGCGGDLPWKPNALR